MATMLKAMTQFNIEFENVECEVNIFFFKKNILPHFTKKIRHLPVCVISFLENSRKFENLRFTIIWCLILNMLDKLLKYLRSDSNTPNSIIENTDKVITDCAIIHCTQILSAWRTPCSIDRWVNGCRTRMSTNRRWATWIVEITLGRRGRTSRVCAPCRVSFVGLD